MKKQLNNGPAFSVLAALVVLFLMTALVPSAQAAFTINVTGKNADGTSPRQVTDYKWLVQEDNAYDAVGNVGVFNSRDSISVSIAKSSAKVLATGTGTNPVVNLPSNGRYFVSVMAPGYTMTGGAIRPGETVKSLDVYKTPIVAAQIKVLVFHDKSPVNGAPDAEPPLPGFKIILYDQFGQQTQDIFGNALGTTYNPDGSVNVMSSGNILSSATLDSLGFANVTIPNLAPGKYGVRAIPLDGRPWVQTSTIEGTPGIDTWVIAGEPPYYEEAGFFGVHAFIGFVLPSSYCSAALTDPYCINTTFRALVGTESYGTITGQVVQNRINRPPAQMGLNPGEPVPDAWIALSDSGATLRQVYAAKCAADGSFSIINVPPGTYSLTMWDAPLDQLIDFRTVTVPPTGGPIDLGKIPVFQWFGTYEGSYFKDTNPMNGIRDAGEEGIPNLAVGFRFRDGSIYQAQVSDAAGNFSFNEVFPFFKWIIAESDYSRFYPSGATVYVDKGGKKIFNINDDPADPASSLLEKRVEAPGPGSLLQGMLLYFDNSARIDWGRAPYPVTVDGKTIRNGGISGVISYAFTRAAADPRYGSQSTWEPGQGDVELKLYKVTGFDPASGKPLFDASKPVATTVSDSWNRFVYGDPTPQPDNRRNKGRQPNTGLLTGCLDTMQDAGLSLTPAGIPLDEYIDCAETISVWNQTKPAVYDGGWIVTDIEDPADSTRTIPIPAGQYVVEVIPPLGYEIIKEEDLNYVVSGESYLPSRPQPAIEPAVCVGPDHVVPQVLSFDGITALDPLFAGTTRPLCNMKLVTLNDGQNAAADFRIFTQVSLAARLMGLVTDDLALEFRAGNPRLGDKPGVTFMPISIQDFNGHELVRTYTDEWGIFETLVPSTFTTNIPNPTGVSPHMVKIVLNHLGFDYTKPDVWYKANYPTVTWKIDVWPGKITYSDTPIIPIRPNIGAANLDCNPQDGTPAISQVNGPVGGPWIESSAADTLLTISSFGATRLSNPDPAVGGVITRDFGFGKTTGTVTLNGITNLPVQSWTNTSITVKVPAGTLAGAYQLDVTRGDNYRTNVSGITLHVGVPAAQVRRVPSQFATVQAAIDAAANGDLILIAPGTYPENLIMWKPVKLQGYGAAATAINAGYFPPEKQTAWANFISSNLGTVGNTTYSPDPLAEPTPIFTNDRGSAILVLGRHDITDSSLDDFYNAPSRIDGLQITQATLGSGIYVHAFAHNLQITNNRVYGNQGTYGGGIRLGTPAIPVTGTANYVGSFNDNVMISRNDINSNGGTGFAIGSGGGIALFEGSDNYRISDSFICGNYATLAGAGIAQQGLSNSGWMTNPDGSFATPLTPKYGVIERNTIIFNEAFDEGAGIFLGGEAALMPTPPVVNPVTPGVGNVIINDNLIQGNKAGNLGGGISLLRYNGLDVENNPLNLAPVLDTDVPAWHKIRIYNNMIVNNISAGVGGGIGIVDAVNVDIVNNTISNNDSTATGETAFGNVPFVEGPFAIIDKVTTPQPAGIGVQPFSGELISKIDATLQPGYVDFSSTPLIANNIITGNFSYYWANPAGLNPIATLSPYKYWDVGVFSSATAQLKVSNSILTGSGLDYPVINAQIVPDITNKTTDPQFVLKYRNVIDAFQGGATLGNFITFSYSPLTLTGDYHIKGNSSAIGSGSLTPGVDSIGAPLLVTDFDGDNRPIRAAKLPDSGADEYNSLGDVNSDNKFDFADVMAVLRLVVAGGYDAKADVYPFINGRPAPDGILNLSDALLLLQRAAGFVAW